MTLRFGPARNESVIIAGESPDHHNKRKQAQTIILHEFTALLAAVADQTPTPTRFLKNCEEVGLFNELTSPFEHDFKKATEDDIKKVQMPV